MRGLAYKLWQRQRKNERYRRQWKRISGRDPWPWLMQNSEKHNSPFGCGVPRCFTCHSEKLSKKPRPRDVRLMDAAVQQSNS